MCADRAIVERAVEEHHVVDGRGDQIEYRVCGFCDHSRLFTAGLVGQPNYRILFAP
jgi:hypothetical protein